MVIQLFEYCSSGIRKCAKKEVIVKICVHIKLFVNPGENLKLYIVRCIGEKTKTKQHTSPRTQQFN